MRLPDGKLYKVLADDDNRRALFLMLDSEEPLTQGQLGEALNLKSGPMSRRMAEIEDIELVWRESAHAPYQLRFPAMVRQILDLCAGLNSSLVEQQFARSKEHEKERRAKGMDGGAILDRAKESS